MSFTKYLESKNLPKILINLDDYKKNLQADIFSLIFKPDHQLIEVRKNIVNIFEISKILLELAYPRSEELKMAIRTGEPKKVSHAHMVFRNWANFQEKRQLSDKIEMALFHYQTKLYGKEFSSEDADKIIDSAISESLAILEQMSHKINLAISRVSSWQNHQVLIEGLFPNKEWVINEAKIIIGENFKASFVYENTPIGFKIKNIEENEIPESMAKNFQDLIYKLSINPKYNRILTLYMNRPTSERRYYEIAKRDLSLGIEAALPHHVVLSNIMLNTEEDVWKVRLEEKYIHEHIKEGNFKQYNIVGDEAPIRWIERVNYEK
jgi:hypothetical protein